MGAIAGAARWGSSGIIAGVASMLAFNAGNHGSAMRGSSEASFMLSIRMPVRRPPSAMN